MWKYPKRCSRGFAWPPDQGNGSHEPGFHSWSASVWCHVLAASIPTGWQGLYVYPWQTGMLVSKSWHVGPFLPLQLPRIMRLMPRLHIVGSRHKPLSIDPLCFPCGYLYLGVAIILSPCWLEREGRMWGVWQRTIPMLIASGVQGVTSQFLLHPSVDEAMARS